MNQILIITGEVSGDLHAAPVVNEILKRESELSFWGTGGTRLQAAGIELVSHIDDMAVMGFSDIPRALPRLARLKKELLRQIVARNTELVILVDYPGFNLNFARALKRLPQPPRILYYIAPQVWAWRAGRIKEMKKTIDRLAVVFPFEYELFRKEGLQVDFVGHPLLDELSEAGDVETATAPNDSDTPVLALLPGSRLQEVKRHLPVMLRAASLLMERTPDLTVQIGKAPNLQNSIYNDIIEHYQRTVINHGIKHLQVSINPDSRSLLKKASVAAVCSGTATLEAALSGAPQVVVYRTSSLNYRIARWFVQLTEIALVNVVAGKQIVPELIQQKLTAENLVLEIETLMTDEAKILRMKEEYKEVKNRLGTPGAAGRVAEIVCDMLAGIPA